MESSPHGVKVKLTSEGLEYVINAALKKMAAKIEKKISEDITGVVKKIEYSITELRITQLILPVLYVSLKKDKGAVFESSKGSITIEAEWDYSLSLYFFDFKDKGQLTASSNGLSLGFSTFLVADTHGRPQLETKSCSVSLQNLILNTRGKKSSIYNVLLKTLKNLIKSLTEKFLYKKMNRFISVYLNQELSNLNYVVQVTNELVLDMSLVCNPIIKNNTLEFLNRGTFHGDPIACLDFSEMNCESSKMVYVYIREFPLNSAGRILFQKNLILYSHSLNNSKIFGYFGVGQNYSMLFKVVPSNPPIFQISESGIRCQFGLTGFFYEERKNEKLENILKVHFDVDSVLNVTVSESLIKMEINNFNRKFELLSENSHHFEPETIENFFKDALDSIIPKINNLLKTGVPLPELDIIKSVKSEVMYFNGFMSVSSNFVAPEQEPE